MKITYVTCEQLDESMPENEGKSYVAVKRCRMLRSGVQLYARDEVPAELLKELPLEKQSQAIFKVYRKPEAVVKHLKDFNYIAFVNTHPDVDVTPDNYKQLSIGNVGGTAKLVTLDDGNVYVENEVVFTDKEAYQEYKDGKKEVSIGLMAMWKLSDSAEYDFEVYDFENVNHLALVPRARAGKQAAILDSNTVVDRISKINLGGNHMRFLGLLGIKKASKDADTLSAKLFAGVAQIKKEMKDEDVEKVVNTVMDCINPLGETEQKKVLVGIVTDAFANTDAVMGADEEAKKKLADSVDKLYAKCQEHDAAEAQKVIDDACGSEKKAEDEKADEEKKVEDEKPAEKDEKKDEEKKDEGKTNDADVIGAAVESAVSKALDSLNIDAKVEEAVKKALNLEDSNKPKANGAVTDGAADMDISDLLPNGWGR